MFLRSADIAINEYYQCKLSMKTYTALGGASRRSISANRSLLIIIQRLPGLVRYHAHGTVMNPTFFIKYDAVIGVRPRSILDRNTPIVTVVSYSY